MTSRAYPRPARCQSPDIETQAVVAGCVDPSAFPPSAVARLVVRYEVNPGLRVSTWISWIPSNATGPMPQHNVRGHTGPPADAAVQVQLAAGGSVISMGNLELEGVAIAGERRGDIVEPVIDATNIPNPESTAGVLHATIR